MLVLQLWHKRQTRGITLSSTVAVVQGKEVLPGYSLSVALQRQLCVNTVTMLCFLIQ